MPSFISTACIIFPHIHHIIVDRFLDSEAELVARRLWDCGVSCYLLCNRLQVPEVGHKMSHSRYVADLKIRQWHDDVSILPSTIFLRAELAHQTELKTALAMPLCKDSRVLAVCIFYSRFVIASNPQLEKTCLALANEVLASTYARG